MRHVVLCPCGATIDRRRDEVRFASTGDSQTPVWRCSRCRCWREGQLDWHGPRDKPGVFDRQWSNECASIILREWPWTFLDEIENHKTPTNHSAIWEQSSDWERASILLQISTQLQLRVAELSKPFIAQARQAEKGDRADDHGPETKTVFRGGRAEQSGPADG